MGKSGIRALSLGFLLALAGGCALDSKPRIDDRSRSEIRAYVAHIADAWSETPGSIGLLPALEAEVETASRLAAEAVRKPGDLRWMQAKVRGIRHAMDPGAEPTGPGLGFGAVVAVRKILRQIRAARDVDGASPEVRAHAKHVAASARNVADWCDEIVLLSGQALSATGAAGAADRVRAIERLTRQVREGVDADGDGKITWVRGEGGIAEVRKHLGFLRRSQGAS